ncbi:MAG: hypothetical protein Ta2B_26640 [Termitinemataceae bacterium]|nr:MAG: hypothetical protein Ta2B_26640 [Termitinemataceae bacterium]
MVIFKKLITLIIVIFAVVPLFSQEDNVAVISGLFWSKDGIMINESDIGDEIEVSFTVENIADGASVIISVYEDDDSGTRDFVDEFSGIVSKGRMEITWTVIYDSDQVGTRCAVEKEERGWTVPNYIFIVRFDDYESTQSPRLTVWDKIEFIVKDDNGEAAPFQDYSIDIGGEQTRTGYSDENGYILEKHVPVGYAKFELMGDHNFETEDPSEELSKAAELSPDLEFSLDAQEIKQTAYRLANNIIYSLHGNDFSPLEEIVGRVVAYNDDTYICVETFDKDINAKTGRLYEYSEFKFDSSIDFDKFVFDSSYEDVSVKESDTLLYVRSGENILRDSLRSIIEYYSVGIFPDNPSLENYPKLSNAELPKVVWFKNNTMLIDAPLFMQTSKSEKTFLTDYFLLCIDSVEGNKITYTLIALNSSNSAHAKIINKSLIKEFMDLEINEETILFFTKNGKSIIFNRQNNASKFQTTNSQYFVYEASEDLTDIKKTDLLRIVNSDDVDKRVKINGADDFIFESMLLKENTYYIDGEYGLILNKDGNLFGSFRGNIKNRSNKITDRFYDKLKEVFQSGSNNSTGKNERQTARKLGENIRFVSWGEDVLFFIMY